MLAVGVLDAGVAHGIPRSFKNCYSLPFCVLCSSDSFFMIDEDALIEVKAFESGVVIVDDV